MDKIFGLLGWAFIIFAAIFIPHAIKKSRNAAKENGHETVAVVSLLYIGFNVDDHDYNNVRYTDENGIEHEALLHAARLFDEGTKLRIRYSNQDYLNVFLAEDLELEQ